MGKKNGGGTGTMAWAQRSTNVSALLHMCNQDGGAYETEPPLVESASMQVQTTGPLRVLAGTWCNDGTLKQDACQRVPLGPGSWREPQEGRVVEVEPLDRQVFRHLRKGVHAQLVFMNGGREDWAAVRFQYAGFEAGRVRLFTTSTLPTTVLEPGPFGDDPSELHLLMTADHHTFMHAGEPVTATAAVQACRNALAPKDSRAGLPQWDWKLPLVAAAALLAVVAANNLFYVLALLLFKARASLALLFASAVMAVYGALMWGWAAHYARVAWPAALATACFVGAAERANRAVFAVSAVLLAVLVAREVRLPDSYDTVVHSAGTGVFTGCAVAAAAAAGMAYVDDVADRAGPGCAPFPCFRFALACCGAPGEAFVVGGRDVRVRGGLTDAAARRWGRSHAGTFAAAGLAAAGLFVQALGSRDAPWYVPALGALVGAWMQGTALDRLANWRHGGSEEPTEEAFDTALQAYKESGGARVKRLRGTQDIIAALFETDGLARYKAVVGQPGVKQACEAAYRERFGRDGDALAGLFILAEEPRNIEMLVRNLTVETKAGGTQVGELRTRLADLLRSTAARA